MALQHDRARRVAKQKLGSRIDCGIGRFADHGRTLLEFDWLSGKQDVQRRFQQRWAHKVKTAGNRYLRVADTCFR